MSMKLLVPWTDQRDPAFHTQKRDNDGERKFRKIKVRAGLYLRFRGFACSECSWRFDSAALTGKSFDEMMRNFELQRDKEFTSHVCANHPRTKSAKRAM